jgi:hypothetical protein
MGYCEVSVLKPAQAASQLLPAAQIAQPSELSGRAAMANREQRGNKEKKKPKADKKIAPITSKPPAYVEPQLVRKPHKGKDWT